MDSESRNPILTVMVAGHRPDRLPTGEAAEHLTSSLENLLAILDTTTKAEKATLRLLTGMSDGIDKETARIAEKLNFPLHLMSSGTSKALSGSQVCADRIVWLGANDPAALGGSAVAIRDEVALAFADLLLVVWDGDAPQGLSGGTVRIALAAALAMKPVIWLDTNGTTRLLDRTRLNGQTLDKLSCPHPEIAWLRDCFSGPKQGEQLQVGIAANLLLTLDPSSAACARDIHRLTDYKENETACKNGVRAGNLHAAIMALVRVDWKDLRKSLSAWAPVAWFGKEETEEKLKRLFSPTTLLDSQFKYFDIEAKIAAGRHRDMNWLIYCSSSLAVFAAVAGAIGLWPGGHNVFWPVAELLVVGLVIGGVFIAKKRRWHERWIGHRFIAEQLRYVRMCLPLLGVPAPFKSPAWQVKEDKFGARELRLMSPEIWFLQRTLAEEGLPLGIDGKSFTACPSISSAEISGYVYSVIEDQRDYHKGNHDKLHKVHERLHIVTIGLFVATAVAVGAHFFLHAGWLLLCTAFFPALGGAIHGLTTKLEIARIAGQSAAVERRLAHLAEAIRSTESHTGWKAWLGLRQLALEASRVMSDENAQWQQLIEHQETGFPA